jgi:predicted RNase H-like HicB family nuclease
VKTRPTVTRRRLIRVPSQPHKIRYRISLNIGHDGSTSAHVHDLMGCATLASTKERALTRLESAIPDYYRWLRSKGERIPGERNPQIMIVEEMHTQGSAGEAGGSDPLFSCDQIKCTFADISRCLQLLNYTRTDLDKIIRKIPIEELDWKPRREPRSIRNVLEHIARVDIWYLSRIHADPRLKQSKMKDAFEFLDYGRSMVHEVLPRLTREQRSKTFHPKKWSDGPWPWTATKVLHRLVGHERQHTRYLGRILRLPDNH